MFEGVRKMEIIYVINIDFLFYYLTTIAIVLFVQKFFEYIPDAFCHLTLMFLSSYYIKNTTSKITA